MITIAQTYLEPVDPNLKLILEAPKRSDLEHWESFLSSAGYPIVVRKRARREKGKSGLRRYFALYTNSAGLYYLEHSSQATGTTRERAYQRVQWDSWGPEVFQHEIGHCSKTKN